MIKSAAISLLLLGFTQSAYAACGFEAMTTRMGTDASMRGVADSGVPCTLHLTTRGGMSGTVSRQPAHGSVTISASQYEYTYQSKPGFHGLDPWEATIQGAARGELQPPQKLTVIMLVK